MMCRLSCLCPDLMCREISVLHGNDIFPSTIKSPEILFFPLAISYNNGIAGIAGFLVSRDTSDTSDTIAIPKFISFKNVSGIAGIAAD